MPTHDELERRASAAVADGSPLAKLVADHRKPKPDSAEWWQEVAQGLGVKIAELREQVQTRDEQIAQLREALERIANDWKRAADDMRLNKGQRTREKKGYEVLASCADVLAALTSP